MALFTVKKREEHRLKSCNQEKAVIKTADRENKFIERRYLLRDSLYGKKIKEKLHHQG